MRSELRLSMGAMGWMLAIASVISTAGCREEEAAFAIVSLEGKVEAIDRISDTEGTITVVYYSEKHEQEISGKGRVTASTEIIINGAQAKLADLREGDHVRGEVRVEKQGGKKTQTVFKITVDRPKPVGGED